MVESVLPDSQHNLKSPSIWDLSVITVISVIALLISGETTGTVDIH